MKGCWMGRPEAICSLENPCPFWGLLEFKPVYRGSLTLAGPRQAALGLEAGLCWHELPRLDPVWCVQHGLGRSKTVHPLPPA